MNGHAPSSWMLAAGSFSWEMYEYPQCPDVYLFFAFVPLFHYPLATDVP
jgi:hypothetical protein